MTVVLIGLLGSAGVFSSRLATIWRWEHELGAAAGPAMEVASLRQQLDELEYTQSPNQLRERIASQLSDLTGRRVTSSIDQIISELNRFELEGRGLASQHLLSAAEIRPTHFPTRIAASQQLLWRASVMTSLDQPYQADQLWDRAIALLEAGVLRSDQSTGYQWLGSVWFGRAMQFPDSSERDFWLAQAQLNWEKAGERAPHNPHLAVKLMDVALERGDLESAADWARRALDLHDQSRLDPLRGIGEKELMRIRAIARAASQSPSDDGP